MAPQSRSNFHLDENTILHSRALITSDAFGGPTHTSRHSSGKRNRHGIVTSYFPVMEHAHKISPSNKLDVLFMEQGNKDEHSLSGEIKSVSNPALDTGSRPTQARPGHSVFTAISILPTHLPSIRPILPLSTFVPLPPLLSHAPTTTITSPASPISAASPSGLEPSKAPVTAPLDHETPHQLHKLSTPVIILLAVGSGLLFVGIFIILKVSTRPTRRQRPTPSLPILNDSFSDYDKFTPKDSPIFGGTEKTSPLAGNNSAVWAWTPYIRPEPAVPKPNPTTLPKEKFPPRSHSGQSHYPFVSHVHTPSVPLPSHGNSYLSSYRPPGRAERRSSAPSMSPYFSSPRNSLGTGIGNSVSRPTEALTIGGRRDVQRTGRKHVPEVSSIYATDDKDNPPKMAEKRQSQGLAYDGAVVSSPSVLCVVPQTVSNPSRGGRTRIKSTYFAPGSYPRNSNLPTKISADRSDPMERLHKLSIQKSQSRRDRDTQALTFALGLSSPVTDYAMSSPQPTLYPDDSLSVVESRSPNIHHSHKKQTGFSRTAVEDLPSLPKIVTDAGGSAALGSLMLMDFGAEPTVNNMGTSPTKPLGSNSTTPLKKSAPRNDGRPPRVPSPPPLPSLAQMALEHADPQAYANYKSPTYSIYGLYEHDRKSGAPY
jgi:hypothetical protein